MRTQRRIDDVFQLPLTITDITNPLPSILILWKKVVKKNMIKFIKFLLTSLRAGIIIDVEGFVLSVIVRVPGDDPNPGCLITCYLRELAWIAGAAIRTREIS
jgi:hypothetical protein